jgi:K+-transporting ATPase ATPase C chain
MKNLIVSIKALFFFSILLGLIYPLLIWAIGQFVFPYQATGSIVTKDGKVIGSELIAQKFTDNKYFCPRPSSIDYNPLPSGASNFSLTSSQLISDFTLRKKVFVDKNNLQSDQEIPSEMLFASASGADPHISKQAAQMQTERIARIRNYDSNKKAKLIELIERLSKKRVFNALGEEIINVLKLNFQLDNLK